MRRQGMQRHDGVQLEIAASESSAGSTARPERCISLAPATPEPS